MKKIIVGIGLPALVALAWFHFDDTADNGAISRHAKVAEGALIARDDRATTQVGTHEPSADASVQSDMHSGMQQPLESRVTSEVTDPAVISLARDRGISIDEAAKRIAWQVKTDDLSAAVEAKFGKKFAGIWIDTADNDRVKVGLVQPSTDEKNAIAEIAGNLSLGDATDVVAAKYTQHDLESANDWIAHRMEQADINEIRGLTTAIAPDRNVINLTLPKSKPLNNSQQQLLDASRKRYGDMIEISSMDGEIKDMGCNGSICDPPLRGGIYIVAGSEQCTSGFTARGNADGKYYLLTAGHCIISTADIWSAQIPAGQVYWIGHVANFYNGTNGDAALIAVEYPGYWNPKPWLRITTPETNSYWNDQYQVNATATSRKGLQVCTVGAFSGSHCGAVGNINYSYVSATLHTGMVLTNICNTVSGDSGGAMYTGHNAYGIATSSIPGQCTMAYEPATRAQNQFGVTILR